MLSLVSFLSLAAKAPPVPVPPSVLEQLRDAFLFAGEYGFYVYWFALTGYCLANAKAILAADKNINFFHGCALQLLTAYGGSSICAIICGKPIAIFVNESLAPTSLLAFCALYVARAPIVALMNSFPGSVAISVAHETMRCHVLMNCAALAAAALPPFVSGAYPVPASAPLICGVIGACGGGFLPADKGLKPLEKGTNWRIASGIVCSLWLQLVMRDPNTAPYAVELVPALAQQSWCRFCAVAFCVLTGTASVITGFTPFGANPLVVPAAPKAKQA